MRNRTVVLSLVSSVFVFSATAQAGTLTSVFERGEQGPPRTSDNRNHVSYPGGERVRPHWRGFQADGADAEMPAGGRPALAAPARRTGRATRRARGSRREE
jgi:hypothetical protein